MGLGRLLQQVFLLRRFTPEGDRIVTHHIERDVGAPDHLEIWRIRKNKRTGEVISEQYVRDKPDEIETYVEDRGAQGTFGGFYDEYEISRNKRTGEIVGEKHLCYEKIDNR